jgi:hypothetical protein
MLKHVILVSLLVVAATNARLLGGGQSQPPGATTGQSGMGGMMGGQQMMAEMKAADAKLDALVSEMNAAKGEAKISVLAQAVTELVRQKKAIHEHMGAMDHQMMMQMMSGSGMMGDKGTMNK